MDCMQNFLLIWGYCDQGYKSERNWIGEVKRIWLNFRFISHEGTPSVAPVDFRCRSQREDYVYLKHRYKIWCFDSLKLSVVKITNFTKYEFIAYLPQLVCFKPHVDVGYYHGVSCAPN